ncbi:DNA repair protein RadC [Niabella terrae]
METKRGIKNWAPDDRPREKLLTIGAAQLSNAELLAILIHNGTPNRSAVELAREILKKGADDLNELGLLSLKELMQVKGIGEAKAITIAAALELGRRRQLGSLPHREIIRGSREIGVFLRERFKDYHHEVFGVVYLNRGARMLGYDLVSEGGITGTVADPRIILKKALEKNAVSIVLFHNHPSGSLEPSMADVYLTDKIKAAGLLLDIKVLDHIIVSREGYYSFADHDRL